MGEKEREGSGEEVKERGALRDEMRHRGSVGTESRFRKEAERVPADSRKYVSIAVSGSRKQAYKP
jgi:hypothetical protein